MANSTKIFTGLAGLPACKEPHRELIKYYGKITRALTKLPDNSQYRIATEKMIDEHRSVAPEEVEKKLGVYEELIEQAKRELKLISTMEKYKPWEPLEEKPSPTQWKWPL